MRKPGVGDNAGGFDLAALLAPVAGENPAGADLRQDYGPKSLHYRLRDARAEARAAERSADAAEGEGDARPVTPPQWRTVRELSVQALAASKDLETAAWFTEALLRSDGMAGLRAGFDLMLGLVEGFWDGLYPLPDEDGIATRVAPVAGLNGQSGDGTLIQPLRKLPLFTLQSGEMLVLWQYDRSADLMTISDPDRLARQIAAGAMPFADVENQAHAAAAALVSLREQTDAALNAWRSLATALDRRAGPDSPPTRRVQDLLEHIADICRKYAPDGVAASPEPAGGEVPGVPPGAALAGTTPLAGQLMPGQLMPGQLTNREEALRMLTTVAEYFRRTEPQSPLAYTLSEAVRRGRLSLPALLEEIVSDAATRNAILSSLGIKPPPEE